MAGVADNIETVQGPVMADSARRNDREGFTAANVREMLAEFHTAVAHPDTDLLWLRRTLHDEEHAELVEALYEGDLGHIARELADVVYVAYGTAHAYGIDLDTALREVHRANMQKANGPRREDGKAMKPEEFMPPDMAEAVRDAAWPQIVTPGLLGPAQSLLPQRASTTGHGS